MSRCQASTDETQNLLRKEDLLMDNNNRISIWQNYLLLAQSLCREVDDDLHFKFFDQFDYSCDDDILAVRELYDTLSNLLAFISEHIDELEYGRHEDNEETFSAQ